MLPVSKYQMWTFILQLADLWTYSKLTKNHWQHMSTDLKGKLTDVNLTMTLPP